MLLVRVTYVHVVGRSCARARITQPARRASRRRGAPRGIGRKCGDDDTRGKETSVGRSTPSRWGLPACHMRTHERLGAAASIKEIQSSDSAQYRHEIRRVCTHGGTVLEIRVGRHARIQLLVL